MLGIRHWKDAQHGNSVLGWFAGFDGLLVYMRGMITQYRESPQIRALAVQIVQETSDQRDKVQQALNIAAWVKENIYYVHEFPERIQTPDHTLKSKAGDCDDFTILIGALLESIGIPCKMVVMCWDGEWRHIFPAAVIGQKLLPLDAANTEDLAANPVKYVESKGKTVKIKIA